MVWRRPGDKPLSEPMMVSLMTHICVTRPQWVKVSWALSKFGCGRNRKFIRISRWNFVRMPCFGHKYNASAWNSHYKCDFWHCIFLQDYFGELEKLKWSNPQEMCSSRTVTGTKPSPKPMMTCHWYAQVHSHIKISINISKFYSWNIFWRILLRKWQKSYPGRNELNSFITWLQHMSIFIIFIQKLSKLMLSLLCIAVSSNPW